jgi:hypothetical protein
MLPKATSFPSILGLWLFSEPEEKLTTDLGEMSKLCGASTSETAISKLLSSGLTIVMVIEGGNPRKPGYIDIAISSDGKRLAQNCHSDGERVSVW